MKYGLQMYSVRDLTEHDLRGALQQVAEMGYSFVEFAGFMGNSAEDVKSWLEEYGLQVSSTHTPLAELEDEVLDQTIAYHKAIGCKDIIIPYAKLETKEQIDAFVERVNTLIPKLQAEGISLHYHNHDCDFAPTLEGLKRSCWPAPASCWRWTPIGPLWPSRTLWSLSGSIRTAFT